MKDLPRIMQPLPGDEIYAETEEPWSTEISELFNDASFAPEEVSIDRDGVSLWTLFERFLQL